MNQKMLIHVGYHKTGTTLLQEMLFNEENGFGPLARARLWVHESLVCPNSFKQLADHELEPMRAEAERLAKRGITPVLSHERISGYPASGGFDSKLIADRLKHAFPQSRILIVIREQRDLIYSAYNQYVTDGGALSLRSFLSPPSEKVYRVPAWDYGFYEFHNLISYYQEEFGHENVLILPYEMLRHDLMGFFNAICMFCGQSYQPQNRSGEVNVRRPLLMQTVTRLLNRWIGRNQLAPTALFAVPQVMRTIDFLEVVFRAISIHSIERRAVETQRKLITKLVGARYQDSNRKVADLTDLPLKHYGYDL